MGQAKSSQSEVGVFVGGKKKSLGLQSCNWPSPLALSNQLLSAPPSVCEMKYVSTIFLVKNLFPFPD